MRFGGLIAAIVFAAIAAVIVLRMSSSENNTPVQQTQPQPQQPVLKTTNVFVAAQPIGIGSTISQDMVAIQPWPEHLVLDGFIRADKGIGSVVGRIARSQFQPQEPMIETKLAYPNDPNFLAGMLPKGMRVVTIMTNETEGLAGFVFPGDHVDVLWTHDVDQWSTEPGGGGAPGAVRAEKKPVTETLLNNIKVLAVDQRATGASTTDANGKALIPRSVSLMVSQPDAQRLRLGQESGKLTLELRALVDRETSDPMILTTTDDLSQYDAGAGPGGDGVMIIRGTEAKPSGTGDVGTPPGGTTPVVTLPAGVPRP